jgi:hypothetical protein
LDSASKNRPQTNAEMTGSAGTPVVSGATADRKVGSLRERRGTIEPDCLRVAVGTGRDHVGFGGYTLVTKPIGGE